MKCWYRWYIKIQRYWDIEILRYGIVEPNLNRKWIFSLWSRFFFEAQRLSFPALKTRPRKRAYAHESRHRFFDAVFATTTWIGTQQQQSWEKSWKKEERRTKRCIFNAADAVFFFFFSCFAEELTKSDTLLHFHGAHILLTFISLYIRYLPDGFFFASSSCSCFYIFVFSSCSAKSNWHP